MITAITIGKKHGSKKFELVSGPEVPLINQQANFKALHRSDTSETFDTVQLWTSSGAMRERELFSPADKKKSDADEAARIARENKIQADAQAAEKLANLKKK